MDRLFANLNKKIIIGDSLHEVDTVIKAHVIKNNQPIINVESATILSLATPILRNSGQYLNYSYLDNEEANALFYTFLKINKSNIIYCLIPKESFSYETSKNAYSAINQIRLGKIINPNHKLKTIISDFEDYLSHKRYIDMPLIINNAVKILEADKDIAVKCLGYQNDYNYYLLPSLKDKLTYLEAKFIASINKISNKQCEYLSYINNKENNIKRYKIPCYGYSNVIKCIVNKIKENNYNLGDVAIYTSTSAYNNLIRGYFNNFNINYRFVDGEDLIAEDFTQLFISVLEFLANHFDIKYLYDIYKNHALVNSYKCTEILSKLKADKSQIINKFSNKHIEEDKKVFINDLLDLYNSNDSLGDIYKKALDFTCNHSTPLAKKYAIDALREKERLFTLMDAEHLDYPKKVDLIKSILENVNISKELINKNQSYVLVSNNAINYLPRKYNFFIGLSSKEMNINEIESPLISDKEYNEIIDCTNYHVQLAKSKNVERKTHLINLIKTQNIGEQYFITSIYDSVEFKPLSNSGFYLELDANEENIYFKEENINITDVDSIDEYLYPRTDFNNKKVINTVLSPSSVENIMECPLNYIYKLIYEEIELDNYTNKWLKGPDEGNFVHKILETYFSKANPNKFDEKYFDNIFNDVYIETKKESPFSDSGIQENEKKKVKTLVKKYLDKYYLNKNDGDPYIPIKCELKIDKKDAVPYLGEYKIYGIIDRVDAYVDADKKLHIRIVDYKTYSKSSYKDHKDHHLLSQCVLYPHIIFDYVNKNKDEIIKKVGDFNTLEKGDIIFVYELFKLEKPKQPDCNEIKAKIELALNNYQELIKDPTWTNFERIYSPKTKSKGANDDSRCKYCKYFDYCRLKINKGDHLTWNWDKKI